MVLVFSDTETAVEPKKASKFDQYEIMDKHPVMMLNEYCAKTGKELEVTVSDIMGPTG